MNPPMMREPWPPQCPDYLPPDVWDFAHEVKNGRPERDNVLARLMAVECAPVWKSLSVQGVSDKQSWRLLLDLFYTSAKGEAHDPYGRTALKTARELMPKIADKALELRELLDQYIELSREHGLTAPDEFYDLGCWMQAARDPSIDEEQNYQGQRASPRDMIDALWDAALSHSPEPAYPDQGYMTTPKAGVLAEWVRHILTRYRIYYASQIKPCPINFTDTTIARIGSAVLGLELTRETVKYIRKKMPPILESEQVIFF